jgi:hypothetical protein
LFGVINTGKQLFNLLFNVIKKRVVKKISDGNFQPIANFSNGGNGRVIASRVDDIVKSRLGNAAHNPQLVNGYVALYT